MIVKSINCRNSACSPREANSSKCPKRMNVGRHGRQSRRAPAQGCRRRTCHAPPARPSRRATAPASSARPDDASLRTEKLSRIEERSTAGHRRDANTASARRPGVAAQSVRPMTPTFAEQNGATIAQLPGPVAELAACIGRGISLMPAAGHCPKAPPASRRTHLQRRSTRASQQPRASAAAAKAQPPAPASPATRTLHAPAANGCSGWGRRGAC